MRIKREKRGNRYYIVARDEKGRFITYVKWSSKRDRLEQLRGELKERIERNLRKWGKAKRTGERFVINSTLRGGGKKKGSISFGVTTFIEDEVITEVHKQFAGEIHQVMVDYVENLNVSLTHHEEAIEYVEDWAKWLTSELEDMIDMRLKAYVEVDLSKWDVVNIKASDYLRSQLVEVIERWKGRL